jgi:F-type H+-transporting ATPase subunit alpha
MLRGSGQDILNTIRDEQKISDDTDAKLREAIESFAKSFA